MRHTFVLQVTAETGDVDPGDLMGDLEAFVAEACKDLWAEPGRGWHQVECVDAWEARGEGVR